MLETMTPEQLAKLRHLGEALGMVMDNDGYPHEPGEWRDVESVDVRGLRARTLHYFDPLHDNGDALRLLLHFGLTHERSWGAPMPGFFVRSSGGRIVLFKEKDQAMPWLELFREAIFDAAYIVSCTVRGMYGHPALDTCTGDKPSTAAVDSCQERTKPA